MQLSMNKNLLSLTSQTSSSLSSSKTKTTQVLHWMICLICKRREREEEEEEEEVKFMNKQLKSNCSHMGMKLQKEHWNVQIDEAAWRGREREKELT